jgi:hypothetical protein
MATTPNLITRAVRKQALEERGLIRSQMRLGAGLIALGALSIPLFQVSGVLEGQAATAAFAVAPRPGHGGRRPAQRRQRQPGQWPGQGRECGEHWSGGPATPARSVTCP